MTAPEEQRVGQAAARPALGFAARVSGACHDLRTPLAAVYGFARTLERQGGLDERQGRYLRMVIDGAEDLMRLVDDLSVLARIEGGTFVARKEVVDLRT